LISTAAGEEVGTVRGMIDSRFQVIADYWSNYACWWSTTL